MDRFLGPQMYKVNSSRLEEDEPELRRIKSIARKEAEKVFIQMVINDYICKGKTWEDLQKDFRPSGAMSEWTRDTAELLGLKTTTNYNLMSPTTNYNLMSPLKGSMKKRRKKSKAKSKPKKSKPKAKKSKPRRSKSRRSKARLTKRK